MSKFKSIISFDCETTGLPKLEDNKTKITEFALVGCELSHLSNSSELPRVLHKLVLPFNPGTPIQPKATELSGLDNELLQNLRSFTKEDFDMLKAFVERLPSPVCIVAHNGTLFDYPILRKALADLNCHLPNDIYCVDSWKGFKEIFEKPTISKEEISVPSQSQQQNNETTPKRQKIEAKNILNYKDKIVNEVTKTITPEVCRELFPEEKNPEILYLTQKINIPEVSQNPVKKPVNYKLETIYQFLFGEKFPNSHRAEDDTLALLKCVFKCDQFLEWMNNNAILLSTIKPLS